MPNLESGSLLGMIRGFWQQLQRDSVSFRGDWFWAQLLWSWYKASHLGLVITKREKKNQSYRDRNTTQRNLQEGENVSVFQQGSSLVELLEPIERDPGSVQKKR